MFTGPINTADVAVAPQLSDTLPMWQTGQTPHTRQISLAQIVTLVGAQFLPLAGGTVTGQTTFSSGANPGLIVSNNAVIGGTLGVAGAVTAPNYSSAATTNLIVSPGGNGHTIVFGDPSYGIGSVAQMTMSAAGHTVLVGAANSQIQTNSLFAGLGGSMTFSGTQAGLGRQYGLSVNHNLLGSAAGSVNANNIVVNTDQVNLSDPAPNGLSWFTVNGNVGCATWAASTVYNTGDTRNNGGRLYTVTTGGTSASSGGPTGTGTGIVDNTVRWSYVSPDFRGARSAISATLNIQSQNDPATSNDSSRQWPAMLSTFQASANQGGTAPVSGSTAGCGFASGDQAWLLPGATNWTNIVGREIDVGISTGASAAVRTGLQMVSFGNVSGTVVDACMSVTAIVGAPGFGATISLIGGQGFGVASSGAVIRYLPPFPGDLAANNATYANPVLDTFIDGAGIESTTAGLRLTGGTTIDGAGALSAQSLKVSTSGAVVSVDPVGHRLASAAVVAGGTLYKASDHLFEPVTGSVFAVTLSSGVVTALTVVTPGHYTGGSAPSNPVTLQGGSGVGVTANLTWTAATTLSLSPSGAATVVGGTFSTALLTNAANDAAAATAGVAINQYYRNGSVVMQRIT
jgi:hypothetical protein